jgi:hypothetical protein
MKYLRNWANKLIPFTGFILMALFGAAMIIHLTGV